MKFFTVQEAQEFINEGRADEILLFGKNNELAIPVIRVFDEKDPETDLWVAPLDCTPDADEIKEGSIEEEADDCIVYYADVFNKEQALLDELKEHIDFVPTFGGWFGDEAIVMSRIINALEEYEGDDFLVNDELLDFIRNVK